MSRDLVLEATPDSHSQPSGYVLNELAKKTKESIAECHEIIDTLIERLNKSSLNIKLNALKCIKYLSLNGRNEFRIHFQRHTEVIRACSRLSGPPDPIFGTSIYEKIHVASKECMNNVFNSTSESKKKLKSIEGFGNTPDSEVKTFSSGKFSAGVYSLPQNSSVTFSTASSNKQYYGFGNTPIEKEESFMDKLKSTFIGETNPSVEYPEFTDYRSHPINPSYVPYGNKPAPSISYKERVKGKAGGGWDDDDEEENDIPISKSIPKSENKRAGSSIKSSSFPKERSISTRKSNDLKYEKQLIDNIILSNNNMINTSNIISNNELFIFMNKYKVLNKNNNVIKILLEYIDSYANNSIILLKLLHLLENILTLNESDVIEYIQNHNNIIDIYRNSKKKLVFTKCKKILKMIKYDFSEEVTIPPSSPKVYTSNTTKEPPTESFMDDILNIPVSSTVDTIPMTSSSITKANANTSSAVSIDELFSIQSDVASNNTNKASIDDEEESAFGFIKKEENASNFISKEENAFNFIKKEENSFNFIQKEESAFGFIDNNNDNKPSDTANMISHPSTPPAKSEDSFDLLSNLNISSPAAPSQSVKSSITHISSPSIPISSHSGHSPYSKPIAASPQKFVVKSAKSNYLRSSDAILNILNENPSSTSAAHTSSSSSKSDSFNFVNDMFKP